VLVFVAKIELIFDIVVNTDKKEITAELQ